MKWKSRAVLSLFMACFVLGLPSCSSCRKKEGTGPSGTAKKPARPAGPKVTALASGWRFNCLLTDVGSVECWGANGSGQLGDGTTVESTAPVRVAGLSEGVKKVDATSIHACALLESGEVKCWGSNLLGTVGNGGDKDVIYWNPEDVKGLDGPAADIAVGGSHTCALMKTGKVRCWGFNEYGQLGGSDKRIEPTAVEAANVQGKLKALWAGDQHTCGLSAEGGVLCWGNNRSGQLGNGTYEGSSPVPHLLTHSSGGARAVTLGKDHTCILLGTGKVACWGNFSGSLSADDPRNGSLTPVLVPGMKGTALAVDAGSDHTCALMKTGAVQCWGKNECGQLGDGTLRDSRSPVQVRGIESGAVAISAGPQQSCAVMESGEVRCWGCSGDAFGSEGESRLSILTPLLVRGLETGVKAIAAGTFHTCALLEGGGVQCWGGNADGELGSGAGTLSANPVEVPGLAGGAGAIVAAAGHTCVIMKSGAVMCWGVNKSGQLGSGTDEAVEGPVQVAGLSGEVLGLAAGIFSTCALMKGGDVKCWGWFDEKRDEDGKALPALSPVTPGGLEGQKVPGILSGGEGYCFSLEGGGVKCLAESTATAPDKLLEKTMEAPAMVAYGAGFTCALTAAGSVLCLGSNMYGEAGVSPDPKKDFSKKAVQIEGLGSGVKALALGHDHACALKDTGGVVCWGRNHVGQLGRGDTLDSHEPLEVQGLSSGVKAIAAGGYHTCALLESGGVSCWGSNSDGQTSGRFVGYPRMVVNLTKPD